MVSFFLFLVLKRGTTGRIVGTATSKQFRSRGLDSDFYITIPNLPPGTHILHLQASLQNGSIAATATLPLMVPVDTSSGSLLPGYRGNIDLPIDNAFLDLPITIQGWVVNPGSEDGTGVGSVEIWNGPRESGQFLTEAIYGTYRPDVADSLDDPTYARQRLHRSTLQCSRRPCRPPPLRPVTASQVIMYRRAFGSRH